MSHFDEARRAALIADILAVVLRRPSDLLPFDAVRETLHLRHVVDRGTREVPLDAIAGTLGREREFNRAFLPREESLRDRWQEIDGLVRGPEGYASVELYQVGEAYFVVDGHHRVSVARAVGAPAIEARVKEFLTPVPVGADESLEEIVLKSGLADFCEATGLVPEYDGEFRTTVPNGYGRMLDHIAVHRYYLGLERGAEVPWPEAVRSWHLAFYRPVADRVRESCVLDEFPGQTEADLYLFVMEHLHYLRERYGAKAVHPARATDHFALLHRTMTSGPFDRARLWIRRHLARR